MRATWTVSGNDAVLLCPADGVGQAYPSRQITMIVPFPAGADRMSTPV
jgi:tripartite-type tricarboxylate transporter receptor subunit TctC